MIIPMKRLTLVAHKADEAEILKALQRLSAVEAARLRSLLMMEKRLNDALPGAMAT